jgi:Fe-S-cluster containining protein
MSELDDLLTARPELLDELVLYKAEMPGFIYPILKEAIQNGELTPEEIALRSPQCKETPSGMIASLNYCAFYDTTNNCCSVYDYRPFVCSSYGDKKYNACPYEDLEEFDLLKLLVDHPDKAKEMHLTAESHPEAIYEDYISKYLERFLESEDDQEPEHFQVWNKLPTVNFMRE